MVITKKTASKEASSPDHARMSLAAAMTLGLKPGRFFRDAQLRCINLLQTYPNGCSARCAYCGLSKAREVPKKGRSFIRVPWPTHSLTEVIDRMARRRDAFDRVCLSMVARKRAAADIVSMAQRIRSELDVPISALLTPTFVDKKGLVEIREAGVDRIGMALDGATQEIFEAFRGSGVGGPHDWDRYWQGLAEGAEVFGQYFAGCHLIVGLGETERQMVETLGRVRGQGCVTHLFSFFPEAGSSLQDRPPPPLGQYRRMQLARYLIDEGLAQPEQMDFDARGRLQSFGADDAQLDAIIATGTPFRTSGCPGPDGQVACNRPFANCRPGSPIRNYPFALEPADLSDVRAQLWTD